MPIIAVVLSLIVGFIELVVGLRIVARFFNIAADTSIPFVGLIYNWSAPFVAPFARFVSEYPFGGFVLDFPAILAALFYGIVGGLLIRVFRGRAY